MPNRCPRCGGHDIQETGVAQPYQTEIPRRPICREFTTHIGCCASCGGRVQGRHPLQTSAAPAAETTPWVGVIEKSQALKGRNQAKADGQFSGRMRQSRVVSPFQGFVSTGVL